MNRQEYYMNLPKDLSGSISKNRFRLELLWGIGKIIDAHKENDDYAVIFDFKCDIEPVSYTHLTLPTTSRV